MISTDTARRATAHAVTNLLPMRDGQRIRVRISVSSPAASFRSVHRTMTPTEARDLAARMYADHLLGLPARLLLDSGELVELDLDAAGVLDWISRIERVTDSVELYGNILGR